MKIGIVSSRKMSAYGKEMIRRLVAWVVERGGEVVTIRTSGGNAEVVAATHQNGGKIRLIEPNERMNQELARAVDRLIVVEGEEGSGTMLAAKEVLEMGKEVWAVPGRITEGGSFVPNFLIKSGAGVVTTLDDLT